MLLNLKKIKTFLCFVVQQTKLKQNHQIAVDFDTVSSCYCRALTFCLVFPAASHHAMKTLKSLLESASNLSASVSRPALNPWSE